MARTEITVAVLDIVVVWSDLILVFDDINICSSWLLASFSAFALTEMVCARVQVRKQCFVLLVVLKRNQKVSSVHQIQS